MFEDVDVPHSTGFRHVQIPFFSCHFSHCGFTSRFCYDHGHSFIALPWLFQRFHGWIQPLSWHCWDSADSSASTYFVRTCWLMTGGLGGCTGALSVTPRDFWQAAQSGLFGFWASPQICCEKKVAHWLRTRHCRWATMASWSSWSERQ